MPSLSSPQPGILQSCFWASFTFEARSERLERMPTASRASSPCSGEQRFSPAETVPHGSRYDADVLILGAGPAGLSVGFELQQRGVSFLILEKGCVGDSWKRMPT